MVEPCPGTTKVDVKVLPMVGGVDDHDALDVSVAAIVVSGFHVDLEADIGAGIELEIEEFGGIIEFEFLTDVERYIGDGVGDVDGSVAKSGAGFGGNIFMPSHGIEMDAVTIGLEVFVHKYVGGSEGVGGGEGVEPECVAAVGEESVGVGDTTESEGVLMNAEGGIEGVEGQGTGNTTLLDGGEEFEIVDFTVVEDGDGERQLEETKGVKVACARVVGGNITSGNFGGVETVIKVDGVGFGRHQFDGLDMQEGRRNKVVVAGTRGEEEKGAEKYYGC